ncbi:hypothetical protein SYNPS1DRAFT_24506 [Syncephalis pseudoplumigaleata]|uniref:Uncharacterized protein n=1 Tax=Syncephalis pseudoplumigaleata TaxID=1712513 RepID=A0A4P9YUH0_9FUNG|nr:hypothetical protein SYNPS1DRAFT_24506 [Syncephalis pseudoplumigaleata]|eukprot:RKP23435.1 hypothetical protein SYNPS1DRAFT_24506 [Syncephalis pseudoplumigaleata]
MPAVPSDNSDNPNQLSSNDVVALILVCIVGGFIIFSALVWCICCGTCVGRELWLQFAHRARGHIYGHSDRASLDGEDEEAHEELLRQEQRIRYADPFDEFIIEETELGLLTRGT